MKKLNPQHLRFLYRVVYFFPLQLLFVHLKKNQQLLLFWLLLFLIIFQQIGNKYGLPLLFLAPEYLGKLSFASYFIVGFSFGGFVMAFNISSYIMNGFRFPFLATLSSPFLKYCINNSFFPALFIITYLYNTYQFLSLYEPYTVSEMIIQLTGFLVGFILILSFSMIYFLATNKDFEKLFGKDIGSIIGSDGKGHEPAQSILHKKEKNWYEQIDNTKTWRVESYIGSWFKLKQTRPFNHYNLKMLSAVFRQNHVNASFFEICIIISILILGGFREVSYFVIPASATLILLITMVLMASSALRSWLRGWTIIVLLGVLLLLNQLSRYDQFYFVNHLYGLDYTEKVSYNKAKLLDETKIKKDSLNMTQLLGNWKNRNQTAETEKPVALFLACSGGGSRAMLWSFLALQHLDSVCQGNLFPNIIMSVGSSGGMIGAAYYRELYLKSLEDSSINLYHKKYRDDMAKDILNPVFFTMAINDMLIRTQRFEYDGETYWKDRGYQFEKTLNSNCREMLGKKLIDYQEPEKQALIPFMVFSPSIINDGRRLLISSQGLSFINQNENKSSHEDIEFASLMASNKPYNTSFLSVLRVNSSFPYLMPMVSLPTNPTLEVFDSGLRDNYGIKTTLKYIYSMQDWLLNNTSGIVILQLRDGLKNRPLDETEKKRSVAAELLSPVGSLYGNLFQIQDYSNDEILQYAKSWYPGKIHLFNYQLNKSSEQNISLSWHLTTKEKNQIYSSIDLVENQRVEEVLIDLFKQP